MSLTRWCIVFAALNIATYSARSLSANVIASASANWSGFSCPWNPDTLTCDGPSTSLGDSTSSTGTNVSAGVTAFGGGSNSTASATYGRVSAFVRASSGIGDGTFRGVRITLMQADASASFDDFITIYGGTGGGTVEGLGDFYCCHYYDALGSAQFVLGGATVSAPHNEINSTPFDLLTPFTFGVPFQIRGSASEHAMDFAPSDPYLGSADGLASVALSTLIVRDANGQTLTGYTYATASEARYTLQGGSFVPEPGTGTTLLLLLLPGFVAGKAGHPPTFRKVPGIRR